MNQLVTLFAKAEDGSTDLVGIGLTDQMIEHIKKVGTVLEPDSRTHMGSDVVVMYAPTLEELAAKIKSITPSGRTEVRVL